MDGEIYYTYDGAQVSTGEMFDRFIQRYAEKMRYVDKEGKSTIKSLIGSVDGFRKVFLEANETE